MNLDKLKKLIRLANDNPNDHEANLAARRVCKILAEKDFVLLNLSPKTAAGKMNEAKTWNDVKRSEEPAWRSRPPTGPGFDAAEFFRNWKRPEWSGFDWSKAPHKDAPTEDDWGPKAWKPNPNIKYDSDGKRVRKQEMRKCTKCGWETMTFRYDEVPWVCNPCHWKEAGL